MCHFLHLLKCDGNLICHQRNRGQAVPGCTGKSLATSRDYCIPPGTQSRGKLGECEGDCNRNSDCEGNLVCHQRNSYDPIPSGCRGRLSWRTDYCVKPGNNRNNGRDTAGENRNNQVSTGTTATDQVATTSSGSFRLKIYWQEGYDWQEEYFERFCKSNRNLALLYSCPVLT